ncbi:C3orf33 isoform 2 [Pongo abelii]|uniref:C3orf33 isoform 2 n=1 Tax=Pongo abelii TaxID=9601 RepID=A0A2J8WT89_PONAB|nr:C3orf33 isoform 2 [Pongo abelii]
MAGQPAATGSPSADKDGMETNVVARISQWADDHLRLVRGQGIPLWPKLECSGTIIAHCCCSTPFGPHFSLPSSWNHRLRYPIDYFLLETEHQHWNGHSWNNVTSEKHSTDIKIYKLFRYSSRIYKKKC